MTLHEDGFDTLRAEKPMLLLAAVSAASAAEDPIVFQTLHTHLIRLLTERVIIKGERSLELLESIMVMEIWLCPPEDLRQLNFYRWIHIAGTMASQLGLVGDPSDTIAASDLKTNDDNVQEKYKIGLTSYLTCSSAAISLKRQKTLSFTATLSKCLEHLRSSSSLSDRRLAAWVDLQLLAEQTCEVSRSTSSSTQVAYLEQRFGIWKNSLEPEVLNASLLMHFHFSRSKLFELALRLGPCWKELVPPYLLSDNGTSLTPSETVNSQPWDSDTVSMFIEACHDLLDAFSTCEITALRSCPTVTFVRASYACKALLVVDRAMMKYVASTSEQISKTRKHIEATEDHLSNVAGHQERKVPFKVLGLVKHLVSALSKPQLWTNVSPDEQIEDITTADGKQEVQVEPGLGYLDVDPRIMEVQDHEGSLQYAPSGNLLPLGFESAPHAFSEYGMFDLDFSMDLEHSDWAMSLVWDPQDAQAELTFTYTASQASSPG